MMRSIPCFTGKKLPVVFGVSRRKSVAAEVILYGIEGKGTHRGEEEQREDGFDHGDYWGGATAWFSGASISMLTKST